MEMFRISLAVVGRLLHCSAREVAVHGESVVHLLAARALVAHAACLSHVDGCCSGKEGGGARRADIGDGRRFSHVATRLATSESLVVA